MLKGLEYKVKYIQAYIHHMKRQNVQIRIPQSPREEHLLNHAFTVAKKTMNEMGKEINI